MNTYEYFWEAPNYGVVAGYDGSPGSLRALEWAAAAASGLGAMMTVCLVWSHPPARQPGEAVPAKLSYECAIQVLREGVGLAETITGRGRVSKLLLTGRPERELCALTSRAGLMVVGARGCQHPAASGLGRVSAYLTAHAHGPIVVLDRGAVAHEAA